MRGLLDDLLVADGMNGSVKLPNIIFCLGSKIQDIDITIFLDFFAEIEPRIHPYPVLFGFHSSITLRPLLVARVVLPPSTRP